ncbi:hypothetical protein [Streptomyces sp. NPDC059918]|uniref:hypothetical protein n=1 Tax=unclassified Streptomyces TaxID=2593676 RepID=UPI00365B9910
MQEQEDVEARLRAMEEALDRVGTSFDERATWQELAAFVFRTLCDAAAVDVIGHGGRIERVASAGARDLLDGLATERSRIQPSILLGAGQG